jgi:hypothetical protein
MSPRGRISRVLKVYQANVRNRDAAKGAEIPSSGRLYAFKVGTLYVGADPAQNVGEFASWVTVDGRYKLLCSGMGKAPLLDSAGTAS